MTPQELLLEAVKLNEQTIRFLDTKAQITAGVLLFGVGAFNTTFVTTGGLFLMGPGVAAMLATAIAAALIAHLVVLFPVSAAGENRQPSLVFARGTLTSELIVELSATIDITSELARELSAVTEVRISKSKRTYYAGIVSMVVAVFFSLLVVFARVQV